MKNMNAFMYHCVFIPFFICLLIETASCLSCFECFSSATGNCGLNFQHNKAALKWCNSSDTICYKETKVLKGIPVVLRDCGTFETCNNITQNCFLCDTDMCNGSSTVFTILPWISSFFLLNLNKILSN